MNPLIVLILLVGVPTILITLARAKAALIFMSLCVGSVLSLLVSDAALDMMQTLMRGYNDTSQSVVQLGLLLFPALLSILFLSRTVAGSKWLINVFPALLTGILVMYLAVPLLPPGVRYGVYGSTAWSQLLQYQSLLISVAALASLAQLWAGASAARIKKKGKHGK